MSKTIFSLRLKDDNIYSYIFGLAVNGLLVSAISVAVYFTSFRTILIGIIPIGIMGMIWIPSTISKVYPWRKVLVVMLKFFLVGVSLVSARSAFFSSSKGYIIQFIEDHIYYAKIANYIKATGIEDHTLDFTQSEGISTTYHYLDIYFHVFVSLFVDALNSSSLIGISYSVLSVVLIAGLVGFGRLFGGKGITLIAAFISLFYVGLIGFEPNTPVFEYSEIVHYSLFNYPKTLLIAILLIVSISQIKMGNIRASYLTLLILSVGYVTIAPPILISIIIVSFGFWVVHRTFIKRETIFSLVLLLFTIFWIFGRTKLSLFNVTVGIHENSISSLFNWLSSVLYFKNTTVLIIKVVSATLVTLIPVTVFLLLKLYFSGIAIRKTHFLRRIYSNTSHLALFVLLIFLGSGIFCWSVFYQSVNSYQLYNNLSVPIGSIFIFSVIIEIGKIKNVVVQGFLLCALIISSLSGSRLEFQEANTKIADYEIKNETEFDVLVNNYVQDIISMNGKNRGCFLRDYSAFYSCCAHEFYAWSGGIDKYYTSKEFPDQLFCQSLSMPEVLPLLIKEESRDWLKEVKATSSYVRFLNYASMEDSKNSRGLFLKEYEVTYIFAEWDAMTFELPPQYLLVGIDSLRGVDFYVLNKYVSTQKLQ